MTCACGCGLPVPVSRGRGRPRLHATPACRRRADAERKQAVRARRRLLAAILRTLTDPEVMEPDDQLAWTILARLRQGTQPPVTARGTYEGSGSQGNRRLKRVRE